MIKLFKTIKKFTPEVDLQKKSDTKPSQCRLSILQLTLRLQNSNNNNLDIVIIVSLSLILFM